MTYPYVLLAFPTKLYWISLQLVGVKPKPGPCNFLFITIFTVVLVHVNAVVGLLNACQVRHVKGLYEEESSIERKPTAGAGLPSGILFNAVDTRVTQQNVTFLIRHPGIESSGSEMESRKTYQDESGNDYVQVSTRSDPVDTVAEKEQSELVIYAEAMSARALCPSRIVVWSERRPPE
ncbi:hypothetical protein BU15DRAFT_82717 [Melanogaster broomeanus]|nr:hypothetical protein BU15DRAFT_82717 [Melanogaster broomeanus]